MKYKQLIIDNCELAEGLGLRSITTWYDLNSSATIKGRRATRTLFQNDIYNLAKKLHKPCDLISGSLYYLGHI